MPRPLITLGATRGWHDLDLADAWRRRDLLVQLVLRDVRVRYKQTLLGVAWAIVQPLGPMLVFALIFNRFMQLPTEGVAYAVFVYAGLLPWVYFSNAVSAGAASLVANAHVLSRVYFPRLLLPGAAVASGLLDFAVAAGFLVALMLVHDMRPGWRLLALVPVAVATSLLAFAVGTIMATVSVVYRDVRHAFPFLVQLWLFVTPVIYPATVVPERWRWVVWLNPMTGIVEGFRAVLFGRPLDWLQTGLSVGAILVLLAAAAATFALMERQLADWV